MAALQCAVLQHWGPDVPELPEVETVRRGLEPAMQGQMITQVQQRRPNLRWPFPPKFATRLQGAVVTQLRRRSKYILADLSTDETLLIHLGMSGRMIISGDVAGAFHREQAVPEKHDHVVIDMANGARITFNDARRFGAMDLLPTDTQDTHPLLRNIGPEPLGNGFDAGYLGARLAGRKMPIKTALLDQKIVAGLGNIYVCEVLNRTGISPMRASGKVAKSKLEPLVAEIRIVLNEAIAAGGSSLQDHRQTSGDLGYFQHNFRAYGCEGKACPTHGCHGIIQRDVQSGRSTFWCRTCQR